MAQIVIDPFHVVEIGKDEKELTAGALHVVELLPGKVHEAAAVAQAGEFIGC